MESLLLHCRIDASAPELRLVYKKEAKETAKSATSQAKENPIIPATQGELAKVEAESGRTELNNEFTVGTKLDKAWRAMDEAKKKDTQWALDDIDWALRAVEVYREEPELAKNRDLVFQAIRKYEIAAAYFNKASGVSVFPERLGDPIFKQSKDLKKEERRDEAFSNAEEIRAQMAIINYTDNPKLVPTGKEKPGEKIIPVELGMQDIEELAKGPVAQLRAIGQDILKQKKTLNLTLGERTKLTTTTLAQVKNTARENLGEKNDHPLAILRSLIVQDTWDKHVTKLTSGKFNLQPAPLYGRAITNKVEDRLDVAIFEFKPRDGQTPTPEELSEAEETRKFLDANWKDIVSTYKDRPGVNLMQRNPDVIRNNMEQERILKDIRNVPEFEAMKKQPFSRTILSSPAGILLAILGYFFLDKKDKELLTKTLIGTFVVEKAGGLPGLQALYNQAGDQVPWAKKLIDDLRNGVVNEKSKEYSRNVFENWTGLAGIQKETRDWMLRESDGLSEAKKMGIYVILNDQPVAHVRAMLAKKPPNSPGSIGDYIEQWKVQGRGDWWANSTENSWNKVKELGKKLGTEGANKAGAGERYVEQFLFGGIMGITPQDVDTFFKANLEDNKGIPTKPNPMRATVEDTAYDAEQFENALRMKFPDGGGSRAPAANPAAAPGGTASGAPAGAPVAPTVRSAPLTHPSAAQKGEEFFDHAFVGMSGITEVNYDDSEPEWFNVNFKKGTTMYHALKSRKTADEGLWVEALDGDGKSNSDAYSLFFPDLATFQHRFDRTVEIMSLPDGKVAMQRLFSDGLALLTPGTWKLAKIEEFPADANITAKDGWFSVEIETTALDDSNKKLKLYIQAGSDKFQVVNAKGDGIAKTDGTYEFDDGTELDAVLRLTASTTPATAPVSVDVKPADVNLKDTSPQNNEQKNKSGLWLVADAGFRQVLSELDVRDAELVTKNEGKLYGMKFDYKGAKYIMNVAPDGSGDFAFTACNEAGVVADPLIDANPLKAASLDTIGRNLARTFEEEANYDLKGFLNGKLNAAGGYWEIGKDATGTELYVRNLTGAWEYTRTPLARGNPWVSMVDFFAIYTTTSTGTSSIRTLKGYALKRATDAERAMLYLWHHPKATP